MKIRFINTISLFLVSLTIAYAQETFHFEYGDPNIEEAPFAIIKTDNNIYAGIYKKEINIVKSLLLKIDNTGNLIAEREFEQQRLLGITNIDNNIFCYGYNELQDSVSIFFAVLNENLEILTSKDYSIIDYPVHNFILTKCPFIKKGDKIFCYFNCYNSNSFVFVTNENCDSINSFSTIGYCRDICEKPDKTGFLMTGSSFPTQCEDTDELVAFTNEEMLIYKADSINILPSDFGYNQIYVKALKENIIISGTDYRYNRNNLISISIFDTTMTKQSHSIVGTTDYDNNIAFYNGLLTDESMYIYTLSTINNVNGMPYQPYDNWLMLTKTDSLQNIVWEKYYGGDAFYQAYNFTLSSDGGIIIASTKFDHEIANYDDAYIFKVDSEGNPSIPMSIENAKNFANNVIVYPNPIQGVVYVRKAPQIEDIEIEIFDLNGKLIKRKKINSISNIDLSNKSTGTYIYNIIDNKKVINSGKIQLVD